MTEEELDTIFDEGFEAGLGVDSPFRQPINPYAGDDEKSSTWLQGYNHGVASEWH